MIGGQASHAWAEVLMPKTGWTALDPTLGEPVGLRHVRIAYGRDYGDVAPVRGVYKGHAGQRLSVDVRVRPALDDEGREHLRKPSALPPPRLPCWNGLSNPRNSSNNSSNDRSKTDGDAAVMTPPRQQQHRACHVSCQSLALRRASLYIPPCIG